MGIEVEWCEGGAAGQAVRGDGLEDVAAPDVVFKDADVGLVA